MRCARRRAWGPEPPSGSAARLTAMAFSRGNLESARAPARPVEIRRLMKSEYYLLVWMRSSAPAGAGRGEW